MALSKPLQRAMDWLTERGGSGVVDCYGRVLAGGEVATHIDSTTWLRLVSKGALWGEGGRVTLAAKDDGK